MLGSSAEAEDAVRKARATFPGVQRRTGIALYRASFGLLALAAIATQFIDLAGRSLLDPLHFFSYFTIESNLLSAGVFLVLAVRRSEQRSPAMDMVRGGAVVYMTAPASSSTCCWPTPMWTPPYRGLTTSSTR